MLVCCFCRLYGLDGPDDLNHFDGLDGLDCPGGLSDLDGPDGLDGIDGNAEFSLS